jgi:Uma2 family endonuclease
MVAFGAKPSADVVSGSAESPAVSAAVISRVCALEDFIAHPFDNAEWVDSQIIEKTGMTVRHGVIQGRLSRLWGNYATLIGDQGVPCTEAPCRTQKQVRRPDVAYISAEQLAQFGQPSTFPQSFLLIAEIASPTDPAEDLFSKAKEYLESGCEEVWIVFPEAQWVFVMTQNQHLWLTGDEVVSTQTVLKGFNVSVSDLLAYVG